MRALGKNYLLGNLRRASKIRTISADAPIRSQLFDNYAKWSEICRISSRNSRALDSMIFDLSAVFGLTLSNCISSCPYVARIVPTRLLRS